MKKKKWLVDVPVKVCIWIRPENQRKQFEVIKKARPSILFLQSDGGRNEEEWADIMKNRAIFENEIDWDCEVYKLYNDKNKGLYTATAEADKFVFSKVDRCIFLEDDYIPAVSFFRFCAEMLEKYKDDERIMGISGLNGLGVYEDVNADYFFTDRGGWGMAYWKRTYDQWYDFSYAKDPHMMELLKYKTKNTFWDQIDTFARVGKWQGHIPLTEFWLGFLNVAQSQYFIKPKYNQIQYIGFDEKSAHATSLELIPRANRKGYAVPPQEFKFPLKHPKYVLVDDLFDKKCDEVLGDHRPFAKQLNRLEYFWLLIKHKKFKYIKDKTKEKISNGFKFKDEN